MLRTSCNFHTFFGGCQYVHVGDRFVNMFFIEVMSFFYLIYLIILNFLVCIFMHIFMFFIMFITIESLVAHAPLFAN